MEIPILRTGARGFARRFAAFRSRGQRAAPTIAVQVRRIVEYVRREGDRALLALSRKYDGVRLQRRELRVSSRELEAAARALTPADREALRLAARRIAAFHRRQKQASWRYRDPEGLVLGQEVLPLQRVGVYVPGGSASYPSTVLMNIVPARVAGVAEVVMVTPPRAQGDDVAVLAAAHLAGATAVFRVGGAQAIAALAYGTESIPRVDKIIGPGNLWVQMAKALVFGRVDIDKIAGPSEVVVIADESAPAEYVAADLLAQAEHGSGEECALLLTPSQRLAGAVRAEIQRQLARLPRRARIAAVLRRRSALVVVRDLEEAIRLAEEVAPEHLELMLRDPRRWMRRVRNAGAVFLGLYSPAALGDYIAGPNHVLPTGGGARFASPLGVYDFVKRTSVVWASRSGLARLAPAAARLARLEGYDAHAAALRCRFSAGES